MRRSDDISKLSLAICNVQAEITNPVKNKESTVRLKTGGSFTVHYADLPSILDHVRPILAKHGLSMLHTTQTIGDGDMVLLTTVLHSSGQFMESEWRIGSNKAMMEIGATITYARRYHLASLLGIAADDDKSESFFDFGPQPNKADSLNAAARAKAIPNAEGVQK